MTGSDRPIVVFDVREGNAPLDVGPQPNYIGKDLDAIADQFFSEHGFGQSRSYELIWDNRHYPHKAILGTAYEISTGQRLAPGDFEGGKAGAVRVLGKLGFTVQPI